MDTSNSANVTISELEESRIKSKPTRTLQHSLSQAMAEALYQPHTLVQPKPLASRVKDAGKEFLRHNQTCQWIQFIQEPEPPEIKRDRRQTKVVQEREINSPVIKETDSPAVPEFEPSVVPKHPSPLSYEEQLLNLQKQQVELLEQQHRIEEQLEQQRKARQLQLVEEMQAKQCLSEIIEMKEPPAPMPSRTCSDGRDQPSCPPARFRRRLKGCIAQSFAERDEGSIGNLLYNTKDQEAPTDRKSSISNISYGNYPRPGIEGRQYAMSQESGSNISQVLSQIPCCSSIDVAKNSESLATMSDNYIEMIKDRKDGHGDFLQQHM